MRDAGGDLGDTDRTMPLQRIVAQQRYVGGRVPLMVRM